MSAEQRLHALAHVHSAYTNVLGAGPEAFFPEPGPAAPTLREVRNGVFDSHWPSLYTPFLDEVAEKAMANVANRTAYARLFLGPARPPRPAVIAVHGYMQGGHWLVEEMRWPITGFLRRGLDVALPVLPAHGPRAGNRRGAPNFPSADPRLTNEGFRQAVIDIVSLAHWLKERGAPHVGIMGISLGGYTSALVATVSRAIDFVMPMIPLASVADFARAQGRLGVGPSAIAQHEALERANWVASPLARPLRISPSRALVVAAEHDRITPVSHAERIARHFACELLTIPGGHLLQLGRANAFRRLLGMLERNRIL
jgi:pimeloyl-ACP methyl ester carboxylesterase